MSKQSERVVKRFGIGEWYGKNFAVLDHGTRKKYATIQIKSTSEQISCPFRWNSSQKQHCTKRGGVCSLRMYQKSGDHVSAEDIRLDEGRIRITCPDRFDEGAHIYRWVGETILGDSSPTVLSQIGFLESESTSPEEQGDDVGRIDNVLVSNHTDGRISWCALEKQAVYFQGLGMSKEWQPILETSPGEIPFPAASRRPDYRSSGPKRLMPQLQTKVPTLRRWGKKTAVVVDEAFFSALGKMEQVSDVSNSDIAWFVVRIKESGTELQLAPGFVYFTTLERAVEGLTAGKPVALQEFEQRIRKKLAAP